MKNLYKIKEDITIHGEPINNRPNALGELHKNEHVVVLSKEFVTELKNGTIVEEMDVLSRFGRGIIYIYTYK